MTVQSTIKQLIMPLINMANANLMVLLAIVVVIAYITAFMIYSNSELNSEYLLYIRITYIVALAGITYLYPTIGLPLSFVLFIGTIIMVKFKTIEKTFEDAEELIKNEITQSLPQENNKVPLTPRSTEIVNNSISAINTLTNMANEAQNNGDTQLVNFINNEVAKQDIKVDSTIKAKHYSLAASQAAQHGDKENAMMFENEAKKNEIKANALLNSEILRSHAAAANDKGDKETASKLLEAASIEERKVQLILIIDDNLQRASKANEAGNKQAVNEILKVVTQLSEELDKLMSPKQDNQSTDKNNIDQNVTGFFGSDASYASY